MALLLASMDNNTVPRQSPKLPNVTSARRVLTGGAKCKMAKGGLPSNRPVMEPSAYKKEGIVKARCAG